MKGLSLNKEDRYETSNEWLREFNAAIPPHHVNPGIVHHYLSEQSIWNDMKAAVVAIRLRFMEALSDGISALRKRGKKR
jgi:hypothetical protein